MPFRSDDPGHCAYCNRPSTKIVELQISEKPPRGSGRSRGARLGGTTRRVCDYHARTLFAILKRPKRTPA